MNKNLNVNVTASSTDFDRGMRSASASSRQFGRELAKQRREAEQFRENVGKAMLGVGIGMAAAAGLSVKAAIEWESAWTGVEKTVTGNAKQMAALEGQLRSMARELPATHQEIAAVAEAAGQLGIQRENIASFTRTMIAMGETTNLTAEDAATAFAQFANVMGTSQGNFDRMASTVVALGNAGASTEADIVALAQRLSGAGKLMGATEPEILALASSMADLGIEAELGGGAIQRTAIKIETAVAQGGAALEGFANVAGVSAQRFATMYEKRPVEAIDAFVRGLNHIDKSGGDAIGALAELNIKGTQDLSVLLRLKGAGDLLSKSLDRGTKAWRENTALVREAAKRYATTEAQMQVARNNIKDLGITIGQTLLPVVGGLADKIRGLVLVIQNLPGPVKSALGVFGALVGTLSLVGGGALLLGPKLASLRSTASAMTRSASSMNRALGATGMFMTGPWGAAIAAATLALGFFAASKAEAAVEVERFVSAIEADNGVLAENSRMTALKALQDRGMTDALKAAKIPLAEAVNALVAQDGSLESVIARMRAYEDEQESNSMFLVGHVVPAWHQFTAALGLNDKGVTKNERGLNGVAESLEKAGQEAKEKEQVFGKDLPGALGKTAGAAEKVDPILQNLGEQFGETGEEAAKAAEEMLDAWTEAYKKFVDLGTAYDDALAAKEAQERESADVTSRSTKRSSGSWDKFLADVKVTAADYIAELRKQARAQREWSGNMIELAARIPEAMLDDLARMGPEGAEEVALLHSMTDTQLKRVVKLWANRSDEAANRFAQRLSDAAPVLADIARRLGGDVAKKIAEFMRKQGVDVFAAAERMGILIDRGVGVDQERIIKFDADVRAALEKANFTKDEINRIMKRIRDEKVTVSWATASWDARKEFHGITEADGDILERHDAQIAPGGAWRVWAEPETGGEAYIPLAGSKRARSMSILEQVAKKFGVGITPMAHGGMVQAEDGSWVPRSFYSHSGMVQAEDGSRVPRSFYSNSVMDLTGKVSGLQGLKRSIVRAIQEQARDSMPAPFAFSSSGGGNAANMALGRQMAAGYGWTGAQWAALKELWIRESGWNSFADNPTSSAFGIPQALTSMHNVGAAYLAGNPGAQIAWGLNYIAGRHGSPLGALAFHNAHNWYDEGGMLKSGQSGSNKSGKPERILSPRQTSAFEHLVQALTNPQRAARQVLLHVKGGGDLFRDFSFSGMSKLVGKFNDQLAAAFTRTGKKFTRANVLRFLDARTPDIQKRVSSLSDADRREDRRQRQQQQRRERSERRLSNFAPLADQLMGGVKQSDDPLKQQLKQMNKTLSGMAEFLRQAEKGRLARRVGDPFRHRITSMLQRRELIDARLEKAIGRRDAAAGRRRDLVQGVRGNIMSGRGLTSFAAFSPRDVREVLEENLHRVRRFQRQLRRLTRMGFRREIVAQVAQAGPEAGAGLAKTLAESSKAQVAGINKQFAGIGRASRRFSREMGNELFGAGVQASEGLLRGLRKNRRALSREMRRLGRGMIKDIRSELKISSPSREMEWIGEMAGAGLIGGWERQLSGSWFDAKGISLKQTIPQIPSTPVRAESRSVRVDIDYDRLARAVQRTGNLKVSGRLAIDAGRNGGLVGVMRDVAAEEARDEMDWRG